MVNVVLEGEVEDKEKNSKGTLGILFHALKVLLNDALFRITIFVVFKIEEVLLTDMVTLTVSCIVLAILYSKVYVVVLNETYILLEANRAEKSIVIVAFNKVEAI